MEEVEAVIDTTTQKYASISSNKSSTTASHVDTTTPPSRSRLPTRKLEGPGSSSAGSPPATSLSNRQAPSVLAAKKLGQKRFAAATHSSSQKTISKATGKVTASVVSAKPAVTASQATQIPYGPTRYQKIVNNTKPNEGPAMIVMVGGRTLKATRIEKT